MFSTEACALYSSSTGMFNGDMSYVPVTSCDPVWNDNGHIIMLKYACRLIISIDGVFSLHWSLKYPKPLIAWSGRFSVKLYMSLFLSRWWLLRALSTHTFCCVITSQSPSKQEDIAMSVCGSKVAWWCSTMVHYGYVDTFLVTPDSLYRCILVAGDLNLCFSYKSDHTLPKSFCLFHRQTL